MAKSKKRAKPRRPEQPRPAPATEQFDALREGVDSPTPGPLLSTVGVLLSLAAGADDPAATLAGIIRSFSGADRVETSAALLAIATLTVDDDLRRRVRREIADRGHVLPRWLVELHRTEPVDRAAQVSTVFRDADELLVGVTVPGGHPLTAVVRVDNQFGAVATEALVVPAPLDAVIPRPAGGDDPDLRVRDVSAADARVRITAAFAELDSRVVPVGFEKLAVSRPLVEWMVSLLPAGGQRPVLHELSEDELEEIAVGFLTSPFGPCWTGSLVRPLLDDLLVAGSANGVGDPLVWSRRNVRRILDPHLLDLDGAAPDLDRVPDLLRDLVRYGHAERGLRAELTTAALTEVDASADAFRAAVRALGED